MVVHHFNTLLTGGAAIAARRIHESLVAAGVDSRLWCSPRAEQAPPDDTYRLCPAPPSAAAPVRRGLEACRWIVRRLRHKLEYNAALRGRPPGFESFNVPWAPGATPCPNELLRGDVAHLHWLAKWIDYPSFFASIDDQTPIVWTLHDMYPLTGGCHYASGCDRFTSGCGHCPQLSRRGADDLSRRGFLMKQAALQGKNLHVVADSHWLEYEAQRSGMFRGARSFRTIHYGLDTELFRPRDRRASRREFDLPDDAVVIAFGAESVENRRKGLPELLAALGMLPPRPRVVSLVFGKGELPRAAAKLEIKSAGFVSDPHRQAALYSAADLFVIPSREEAFGLTGLEAMACGTPVVGFDTGGIPDFVRPGKTGLLARVGDAADLARQIQRLVENSEQRRRLGAAARNRVLREFRAEQQAAKYIRLYEELAGKGNKSGRAA